MTSTYPASKRTILCIDDDNAVLGYEKALLERSGFVVITAASAQQGLRLATMCKCDAVLLDYEMPGMNGHELAIEIKRIRPELMITVASILHFAIERPVLEAQESLSRQETIET